MRGTAHPAGSCDAFHDVDELIGEERRHTELHSDSFGSGYPGEAIAHGALSRTPRRGTPIGRATTIRASDRAIAERGVRRVSGS
ncbi:hypothetical protein PQR15_34225 [Streptomyces lydicus]|uniref:hypothetical protein n=1 Tax=Streptomyces lydicus TaxID=47763 RepID=UPI000ADED342|nr:hypothetical protein [Streptomyces lydicus]MDC7340583.1 hypothetical protein [Streptomyces lydicus]